MGIRWNKRTNALDVYYNGRFIDSVSDADILAGTTTRALKTRIELSTSRRIEIEILDRLGRRYRVKVADTEVELTRESTDGRLARVEAIGR